MAKKWIPTIGGHIVVQLPSEKLSAIVYSVPSPDTVVAQITSPPLARIGSHTFKLGDYVSCRRTNNGFEELWTAVKVKVPGPPSAAPKKGPAPRLVVDNAEREVKAPEQKPQKVKRRIAK